MQFHVLSVTVILATPEQGGLDVGGETLKLPETERTRPHARGFSSAPFGLWDRQMSWNSLGLLVTRKKSNMEVLIDLVSPTEGLVGDLGRSQEM